MSRQKGREIYAVLGNGQWDWRCLDQLFVARPVGPLAAADCWLAAENLMLAAAALGVGTCCIGSAIPVLNLPDVKAELGIPADVEAVVPVIVGVPREPVAAMPRKEPHILLWHGANTPSASR